MLKARTQCWRWIAAVSAMTVLYYLTGRLGLLTAIPPGAATAIWPPSGIALAGLLRFGNSLWPGIWLGSLVLNLQALLNDGPPAALWHFVLSVAGIATGSTLQALMGATLIRRHIPGSDYFSRPRSVVRFVTITAGICFIAATMGSLSLFFNGLAPWSALLLTWVTWWTGDAVGILVMAPLCLLFAGERPQALHPGTPLEGFALGLTVVLGSLALFRDPFELGLSPHSFLFAMLPVVLWAAIRFGSRGVTLGITAVSATAFWSVLAPLSDQVHQAVREMLIITQAFLGIAAMTGYIVAAAFDERRHLQAELQERLDELRRANHELSRFTWVASHDLQEPLRTVTTYSQLIERKIKIEQRADLEELLHYLVTSSRRLKALVDDLLTYSRLERAPRNFVSVDVAGLVEDAIASLQALARETGAKIVVNDMPRVTGEPKLLTLVFQNLLSNAMKFHKAGSIPHISVSAARQGAQWRFYVVDDGIGIDQQYHARIFDFFERLHPQDDYAGSGIGLATVNKVVTLHGGEVGVASSPGRGSTFVFTLPDRPAVRKRRETAVTAAPPFPAR